MKYSNHSDILAVIFDCDGVLLNSEAIAIDLERMALANIGLEYEYAEYVIKFCGLADAKLVELIDAERRERFGVGVPADFVEALNREKKKAFLSRLRPISGVVELVQKIVIPRAVASSSTVDNLDYKLKITYLHAIFDPHIYSTELVAKGKPSPDIFLFSAEKLGFAPESCIVIEDSVAGVRAGVAAGMKVCGFLGGSHVDDSSGRRLKAAGATYVFADMTAVGEFFGLN